MTLTKICDTKSRRKSHCGFFSKKNRSTNWHKTKPFFSC